MRRVQLEQQVLLGLLEWRVLLVLLVLLGLQVLLEWRVLLGLQVLQVQPLRARQE